MTLLLYFHYQWDLFKPNTRYSLRKKKIVVKNLNRVHHYWIRGTFYEQWRQTKWNTKREHKMKYKYFIHVCVNKRMLWISETHTYKFIFRILFHLLLLFVKKFKKFNEFLWFRCGLRCSNFSLRFSVCLFWLKYTVCWALIWHSIKEY